MGRARFTIGGAMGLVALVALSLAAIARPTKFRSDAVFTVAIAGNLAASIAAVIASGRARSIGIGYAVAGWGYYAFAFELFENPNRTSQADHLLITQALTWTATALTEGTDLNLELAYRAAYALTDILVGVAGLAFALTLTRHPNSTAPIPPTSGASP